MNTIKLDGITMSTSLSDLNLRKGALKLLSSWKIFTVQEMFARSKVYLLSIDEIKTPILTEIRAVVHFLESMIGIDFFFEDWIEHRCDFSCDEYSFFSVIELDKPIEEFMYLQSHLIELNLYELVELKRSKNLPLHESIEINLILWHLCIRLGCKLDYVEQKDYSLNAHEPYLRLETFLVAKLEELPKIQKEILYFRFELFNHEHKTLEQLGFHYNITRERIRQIERKALSKYSASLKMNKGYIFNLMNSLYVISRKNIFGLILKNEISEDYYAIHEQYANVCISNVAKKIFDYDIMSIKNKLDCFGKFDLEDYYGIFEIEDLIDCFASSHKIVDEVIYARHTITSSFMTIVENRVESVNFGSKKQLDEILRIINEDFSLLVDHDSIRTIENIARTNMVMIGPKTYQLYSKIKKIPMEIINQIEDRVNKYKIITSTELFNVLRTSLNDYNITNPTGIYGYLKYFFPEKFVYGGVNLVIAKLGYTTSWHEIIRREILQKQEPIEKSFFKEKYPDLTDIVLNNIVVNERDILQWGRNRYYLSGLIVLENKDKAKIWGFVNRIKVVTASQLYLFIYENISDLLTINHISSEDALLQFIKHTFQDVFEVKYNEKIIISI